MNRIRLETSVYKLCTTYPEIIDILSGLGFRDITKPGMLATMGKIMTIAKAAKMKKIELSFIIAEFEKFGFTITNKEGESI